MLDPEVEIELIEVVCSQLPQVNKNSPDSSSETYAKRFDKFYKALAKTVIEAQKTSVLPAD